MEMETTNPETSGVESGRTVKLDEILDCLKTFQFGEPDVYLVGGLAANGETKGKIDVLVKYSEGVMTGDDKDAAERNVRGTFPSELAKRVNIHFDNFQDTSPNGAEIYVPMVTSVNSVTLEESYEKAERFPELAPAEFADPDNRKYPINSYERTRAAISYFSQPKNAEEYSKEDQKKVWERIKEAAKKFKIELSPESGPPDLEETSKAIVSYFGNLDKFRHKILPLFPAHKVYVEPFGGRGEMVWHKERAPLEVLSDIDERKIFCFRAAIKLKPEDLSRFNWKVTRVTFDKLKKISDKEARQRGDAFCFYRWAYLMQTSVLAVSLGGFHKTQEGTTINYERKLKEAQKVKHVKFLVADYKDTVAKYDSKETLFFVDPPYPSKKNDYYGYDCPDVQAIADTFSKIKGKVIMVIQGSNEQLAPLLKEFDCATFRWPHATFNWSPHTKRAYSRGYIFANFKISEKVDKAFVEKRTPAKYMGDVTPLWKDHLSDIWPEHKVYVEPFCGPAAILFMKPPSGTEVIADLKPEVIRLWKTVKGLTDADMKTINAFDWMGNRKRFYKYLYAERDGSMAKLGNVQWLMRKLYLMRFGELTTSGGNTFFGQKEGKRGRVPEDMEKARERLKHVKIEQADYRATLKKYGGPDTLFFVDPPYPDHESYYTGGNKEYDGQFDWTAFKAAMGGLKGKVFATLDNGKESRDALSKLEWIKKVPWNYGYRAVNEAQGASQAGPKTFYHLLAANFKPKKTDVVERWADTYAELDKGTEHPNVLNPNEKHKFVKGVDTLTPVETVAPGILVKRDDLFVVNGASGSKVRAMYSYLNRNNAKGMVGTASRYSAIGSWQARLAEYLGIPVRIHYAKASSWTPAQQDAKEHGAKFVYWYEGFMGQLKSEARKDVAKRDGWVYIPFGLECSDHIVQVADQVANLPFNKFKRLVVTVGSGTALIGIVNGLKKLNKDGKVPILGMMVGSNSAKARLEKYLGKGFRTQYNISLRHVGMPYNTPAKKTEFWGIEMDPHYEAKVAPFVKKGDLFWDVGLRPRFVNEKTEKASENPYQDVPPEDEIYKFVVQTHWRGKSVHSDLRTEVQPDRNLLGWTLDTQIAGVVKQPVETLSASRVITKDMRKFSKIDWTTGKWLMKNSGPDSKPRRVEVLSEQKAPPPREWLDVEGATKWPQEGEPVPPGATRNYPGVFQIVDKGVIEYGAQKPWYHEYFLRGKHNRYRITFRKLKRKAETIAPPDKSPELGQKLDSGSWLAEKPQDATPYVLTKAAVEEKWIPKLGYSALPKSVRQQTPLALQFWKAPTEQDALAKRDAFVLALANGEMDFKFDKLYEDTLPSGDVIQKLDPLHAKFVLQEQSWKGSPEKVFYVRIDTGEAEQPVIVLAQHPAGKDVQSAKIVEDAASNFAVKGKVPVGHVLNGAKKENSFIKVIDSGPASLLASTKDNLIIDFQGSVISGEYVAERKGNTFEWHRSVGKADVELTLPIQKIDKDQRVVTGIVLEPNTVDAQGDIVSPETIKDAAYKFVSKYNDRTKLGYMHKMFNNIGVSLVESWIARTDEKLNGQPVKKGSWLMSVKVDNNEKLWQRCKNGEITGFSIGGVARVSS